MVLAKARFPDGQCARKERFGTIIEPLGRVQVAEMGKRSSDIWMVLTERRFLDGQRAPKERFCLDRVPLEQVMESEQIETPGNIWVAAPERSLPQRQRMLASRDGFAVLARVPERVRLVD